MRSEAGALSACPGDVPCTDIGADAFLAAERCEVEFLEVVRLLLCRRGARWGYCAFGMCADPG